MARKAKPATEVRHVPPPPPPPAPITEVGPLRVIDLAKRFAVATETIRNWIKGIDVGGKIIKIAATRLGRDYRFTEAAVQAFLAACNPPEGGLGLASETPNQQAERFAKERDELLAELRS